MASTFLSIRIYVYPLSVDKMHEPLLELLYHIRYQILGIYFNVLYTRIVLVIMPYDTSGSFLRNVVKYMTHTPSLYLVI